MYADREESESRRSVKERLNGNSFETNVRRRLITGKRQRDDDKWEHDLYEDNESQASNRKVGARDLRLKLQKKNLHAPQSGKSTMLGVRDLREKLSGPVYSVTVNNNPPKSKLEAAKSTKKNETVDAPPAVIKKAAIPASRKKASQKNDTSVDGFLHSLGLEKYSITFQAEEVDMAALVHMSDEDLKALGIPMGPRKKIILALETRRNTLA